MYKNMINRLIKKIIDIKIYDKSLLKILAITNEDRIITLEMLIDINSFSLELISNITQDFLSNITKSEKRGKIELNIVKDKDDGLFTIRDITDKILDKFTEESEEN